MTQKDNSYATLNISLCGNSKMTFRLWNRVTFNIQLRTRIWLGCGKRRALFGYRQFFKKGTRADDTQLAIVILRGSWKVSRSKSLEPLTCNPSDARNLVIGGFTNNVTLVSPNLLLDLSARSPLGTFFGIRYPLLDNLLPHVRSRVLSYKQLGLARPQHDSRVPVGIFSLYMFCGFFRGSTQAVRPPLIKAMSRADWPLSLTRPCESCKFSRVADPCALWRLLQIGRRLLYMRAASW